MLRKFIIVCLVISTFGYGAAWAFDGHFSASQTQAESSFGQLADGDNPASDHHNDTGCDHCCHASAHLLGIAADNISGLSENCRNLYPADTTTQISFLAFPASPPPKH